MATEANAKLLGLLSSIVKREYYGDDGITMQIIRDQLYPKLSSDDFQSLYDKSSSLLKAMARSNMDMNQAEAFLKSQSMKKNSDLSEESSRIYKKIWKTHHQRIHNSLIEHSNFNNKLKTLSWRIDLITRSKSEENVNVPTAIVEMQYDHSDSQQTKVLHLEMDDEKLDKVIRTFKDIEQQIKPHIN